jgi:transcriptional regulator with XRE-family HTH domain
MTDSLQALRLDVTHDTVQPGPLAITSDVMANGKPILKIAPMDTIEARSAGTHVGTLVRDWRLARRRSQLDLSMDVGMSARHLSYVETGKSQPSREMLVRLANALEMPLRDRNALLVVAGFAPIYRESQLTTPEMAPVRQAVEFILRHQEPYPAIVMNRYWDVLMLNDAANRIFGKLKPGGPKHGNVMHQVFDPTDMRSVVNNWNEIAEDLIRHLHDEAAAAPTDARLQQLLKEVLAYPGVPTQWRTRELGTAPLPMITTVLRNDELELRFLSTITTFGTTRDITIDELRIESMFPVDEATMAQCKALAM